MITFLKGFEQPVLVWQRASVDINGASSMEAGRYVQDAKECRKMCIRILQLSFSYWGGGDYWNMIPR